MKRWPGICTTVAAALTCAIALTPSAWCRAQSPRTPTSRQSGNLRALVNVDDAIVVQNPLNFGTESLITDLSYFARRVQGINSAADVYRWIRERMPTATIGRYHSSRYAIPATTTLDQFKRPDDLPADVADPRLPGIGRVPFDYYVPAEKFSESELLPHQYDHHVAGLRIVDFRQPPVRAKLVALMVDDALRMGATALMTDEWAPSAAYDGSSWIDTVIAYETQLTAALHEHGILHFPNMHFRIGGKNDFDGTNAPRLTKAQLRSIAENCDCLLLERPCDPGANPKDVVSDYQTIAATGTPCVLIGTDDEFLAALAMLTATDQGPLNYVAGAVWQPEPSWMWLPARLGAPLAGVKWLDQNTAIRLFERGKVVVRFDERTGKWYSTSRVAMNHNHAPVHGRLSGHRRR
jgi:hypothetical protein